MVFGKLIYHSNIRDIFVAGLFDPTGTTSFSKIFEILSIAKEILHFHKDTATYDHV